MPLDSNDLAALESNFVRPQPSAPAPPPVPQGPTPEEMLRHLAGTPLGHPSFSANRARPGVPESWNTKINPVTGQPFKDYAEWAAVAMPQLMQGSRQAQMPFSGKPSGLSQPPAQAPSTLADLSALVQSLGK